MISICRAPARGEEIDLVHALGGNLVDPAIGKAGDIDTAAVHMQTKRGAMVVISNSRRATYGHDQRIEVHGQQGDASGRQYPSDDSRMRQWRGLYEDSSPFSFIERYAEATARSLAFLDALEKGVAPKASGHDGLMAQKLAEAATKAGRPATGEGEVGHFRRHSPSPAAGEGGRRPDEGVS